MLERARTSLDHRGVEGTEGAVDVAMKICGEEEERVRADGSGGVCIELGIVHCCDI
jgi:hypothetical protein